MIFDLIFAAALILMIVSCKKRGMVNIIMGLVSGVLAIILAFSLQAEVKEAVAQTDLYRQAHHEVFVAAEEKINGALDDRMVLDSLIGEGYVAEEIADKVMGSLVSLLTFIAAFAILRVVGIALDGVFHLPVLKTFNGLAGMLWGAIVAVAATYILLAFAGHMPSVYEAEFFKSQLESSYLISHMYENNILIKLFIK